MRPASSFLFIQLSNSRITFDFSGGQGKFPGAAALICGETMRGTMKIEPQKTKLNF